MAKLKEVFISVEAQETRVAITEDTRLEEFFVERAGDQHIVGSIFKGKVTSIVPGIGAAFVDIGLGKNGFLYVADIVEPAPGEEAILEGEPLAARSGSRRRSRIEELIRPGRLNSTGR